MYSVEFKPRGTGRRVVGFLTLVCLAATAYFGWQAYEERTHGLLRHRRHARRADHRAVGRLGRPRRSPTCTCTAASSRYSGPADTERFDLTSHYTKIRTIGKPRSGRWRVLIERPANTPFVIDRTMVDPRDFTRVLEAYHHVG